MKNKLVIIKEDNKNYVCYELNEKNYLKRKFNYIELINFISKKIDTHLLYFQNFEEKDILYLQNELDNYFIDNQLDNERLYDIKFRKYNKLLIQEEINNNNLRKIRIQEINIKEKNNTTESSEIINKVKINKKLRIKIRKKQ